MENLFFSPGKKVFIRTLTNYQVGEVVELQRYTPNEFVILKDASWVANMRRFYDTLKHGFPPNAEIEPVTGLCAVSLNQIVDAFEWNHSLPKIQSSYEIIT